MQEILGLVRRCVEDYDMIQSGDTVAVGVSGGKDSLLTLTALARLSRFYPKPFRVVAITVEAGTPGMSFDGVADYCRVIREEAQKRTAGAGTDPLAAAAEKYKNKKGYGGKHNDG